MSKQMPHTVAELLECILAREYSLLEVAANVGSTTATGLVSWSDLQSGSPSPPSAVGAPPAFPQSPSDDIAN